LSSTWQRLYDSPWHQPRLVGALTALTLLALARWKLSEGRGRAPFLTAWTALFGALALVDATVTAADSPLLPAHAGLVGDLAIAFVMLGDARVYALVERYAGASPSAARRVLSGLAWGALVSVIMAPLARTVPAFQREPRTLFLTYELLALTQSLAWLGVRLPRAARGPSPPSPEVLRWLRSVMRFVAVQYALWALADVVILWVHPAGFLLRVVPNVLYYGVFVGYVFWRAPPAIRS
jgi:hypothetical protein